MATILYMDHCVHELEIIAKAGNPEDFFNQVTYIPT